MAKTDTAKTADVRRDDLLAACAQYLVKERLNNLALDPVARFHLGNGASLHAIHWAADLSDKVWSNRRALWSTTSMTFAALKRITIAILIRVRLRHHAMSPDC